jgi:hypothetical protein
MLYMSLSIKTKYKPAQVPFDYDIVHFLLDVDCAVEIMAVAMGLTTFDLYCAL